MDQVITILIPKNLKHKKIKKPLFLDGFLIFNHNNKYII